METSIDTALSSDINVITAEINTYKRIAGEAIFEIGRRLKLVRDAKIDAEKEDERKLARKREEMGGWIRWLTEHVDFSRMQAHRFIEAFVQFGDVTTSLHTSAIFELIQLPSNIDRADFVSKPHTIPSSGETKTVDEMTVRELREVKKALKEAQERAEKAEADYEMIRETLESVAEKPPEIDYARDDAVKDRLRRYEERFGDVEMYESAVFRIPNSTEISASLQTFGYEVRSLLKKYAFLAHYQRELHYVPDVVSEDYTSTLDALRDFSLKLLDEIESTRHGARIINI